MFSHLFHGNATSLILHWYYSGVFFTFVQGYSCRFISNRNVALSLDFDYSKVGMVIVFSMTKWYLRWTISVNITVIIMPFVLGKDILFKHDWNDLNHKMAKLIDFG